MAKPPPDRALDLRTSDGLRLEGVAVLPERTMGSLVACHPHPLYGGTMTHKVVHSLYKAFRDVGFAALRFNFRGAGTSEGEHGYGETETRDVAAAWDALLDLTPDLAAQAPRVVGGFSFGSSVGFSYSARQPACTHRLGIGLPLAPDLPDSRSYNFDSLSPLDLRPLFLLTGDEDEFCPLELFEALVLRQRSAGVPVTAVVIEGANHFFDRKGHVLRQELERTAAAILGLPIPDRQYPAADL